jgi:hypothetical protein
MKRPRLRLPWTFGSGPAVAALFARVLALISLVAWLSLGAQVRVLIGARGLLPVGEFMDAVRGQPGVTLFDVPTLFWRFHSDAVLAGGVAVGAMLSVLAFLGVRRRLCFALATALYLSYATVARDFLSFQWDNLLLECGLLAAFLPTAPGSAPAPIAHFLFRFVLFKLYFESGIAKWQSPIHDWQDGSAMTFYYETAPLPTWLAFYAHHLPVWWHHLESRATLVLELVVPFAIFGPRPARLGAAATFTLFQIANAATANYGFFCYLATALHLFLLDDRDVEWARARLARHVPAAVARLAGGLARLRPAPAAAPAPSPRDPQLRWLAVAGAALFVLVSLAEALTSFTNAAWVESAAGPVLRFERPFRLVNTYHLFQAITRERIEPEFQTLDEPPSPGHEFDDDVWTPHYLWHKPGDVRRAADFVAPHQPRVDFQLWFYGLRRHHPAYVSTLVERMCEDPAAVQPLFRVPLPPHPAAVRIVYWQYTFASPSEKRATGAWWHRERVAVSRNIPCPAAP